MRVSRFATALTVRDISGPGPERVVGRNTPVPATNLDEAWSPSLEDAGYERQPPARVFAYRLAPTLQAEDGQTLGYPFVGIVENRRESAFISFGDGHGVWESAAGATLPFYARNYQNVTQWMTRLSATELMPRMLALAAERFRTLPPGNGTPRRLTVTPDATQSYGLEPDAGPGGGTGLVWAGLRPGAYIANSAHRTSPENADRSTVVQVTNLGITVKDSPQSTLVFVTRLDNGTPVAGATVSVINTQNQQLWRGATNADGVAMAPALPLRDPDDWYEMSFIVTAEHSGDIAYVASDWNEGIMPWDFGYSYSLWESTDILRGSVFTDRGVYRPGEEVHAKAILRADTPTGVRLLPAGSRVEVAVTDARGREVDRRTLTVGRWSSAEWTWTVPAGGSLGNYSIEAKLPGVTRPAGNDVTNNEGSRQPDWLKQVHGSFLVAAYRRPDFRVEATLAADQPVAGAALTGRIDARYLFGSALGRRPVRWSITRQLGSIAPGRHARALPGGPLRLRVFRRSASRARACGRRRSRTRRNGHARRQGSVDEQRGCGVSLHPRR